MNNGQPSIHTLRSFQLVFIAAAILYLELAVIRFTAAEILYLGFFSNFILISAFVGLSLGFLSASGSFDLKPYFSFVLIFLFAFTLVFGFDAEVLMDQKYLFFFIPNHFRNSGPPAIFLLPVLFVVTAFLFAILGQQTGRMFKYFTPLKAYTLDIAGSLMGIFLFSLQSYFWSSPVTWIVTLCFLLVMANLFSLDDEGRRHAVYISLGGICVLILLFAVKSPYHTIWSFYQKVQFVNEPSKRFPVPRIYANGIPHQFFIPSRKDNGSIDDILIVGAGSGTDTAVALLNGALKVDAVEIDPGIVVLGSLYYHEMPYVDDRVNLLIKDGRDLLRNSTERYDLIVFALPDSMIRLSPMNNVRLESYLFTLESFEDVKKRLRPRGTFVLYNQYRWPWLKDRLAAMLWTVFDQKPTQIEIEASTVFSVRNDLQGLSEAESPNLDVHLPTDDWPFFYLKQPMVPPFYLAMLGMFLLSGLFGIRFLAPKGTLARPEWPFFLWARPFSFGNKKYFSFPSLIWFNRIGQLPGFWWGVDFHFAGQSDHPSF
ncbi:hypothetical protein UR09_03315 [Candidatus Nitromaritima sp. SCGC AAA799-A02]|nr:hypothetical protein UR09_03315 [Candidatus Nitromaritima sp. SCGC AAA799-A02]